MQYRLKPDTVSFDPRKMEIVVHAIRECLPELIRGDPALSRGDKVNLLGAVGNVSRVQHHMMYPQKLAMGVFILRTFAQDIGNFLSYIEYSESE